MTDSRSAGVWQLRVTGVDRVTMKRVSRTYEFVSASYTEASTLAKQLAERDLHPPCLVWAAARLRDCNADDVGPTLRPKYLTNSKPRR